MRNVVRYKTLKSDEALHRNSLHSGEYKMLLEVHLDDIHECTLERDVMGLVEMLRDTARSRNASCILKAMSTCIGSEREN